MNEQYIKGGAWILLVTGISLATFMQVLDYSIANVSIPYIAGSLAVSVTDGTWVITSFAVGNAIGLPLTGWLTQRFGTVRVMLCSIILFTLLSLSCGIAFNLDMLVLSRFFQGLVAGPLIPLSQSILIVNSEPKKRTIALAIWNAIVVSAPVLGPILGGWISEDYKWPWIFYINIPVGIICIIILWIILRSRETKIVYRRVDWQGLILLTLSVGSLQIILDKGQQLDWFTSPIIQGLIAISVISLTFLIAWELTTHSPLLEFRLLKIRSFLIGTISAAVSYLLLFGSIVLLPLWLQESMGYTAFWAGLAVSPLGIFPFFFSFFLPYLMKRFPYRYILMTSFLLFATCFYLFSFFTPQISFKVIGLSRFLLGVPLLIYFTPLVAMAHREIPDEKMSSATGIFHFIRIFCGGVGASLFVTLWERRTIFHHHNLISFVTPFYQNAKDLFSSLQKLGFEGKKNLQIINDMVDVQASLLAMNDVSYLSAGIFLALFVMLVFVGKKRSLASQSMT